MEPASDTEGCCHRFRFFFATIFSRKRNFATIFSFARERIDPLFCLNGVRRVSLPRDHQIDLKKGLVLSVGVHLAVNADVVAPPAYVAYHEWFGGPFVMRSPSRVRDSLRFLLLAETAAGMARYSIMIAETSPAEAIINTDQRRNTMMLTLKSVAIATAIVAGLQVATATADIFSDVQKTAPRSIFTDLDRTAPRAEGIFGSLGQTAPRSDIFVDTSRTAPRKTSIFDSLQGSAP